ncbi:hypothetical protein [Streptomyces scopuliridis]|uniref:hypothetical protein n=1 Tax=Streptomyces scopuliridis TaxID=452529 RepID=UPI00341F39FA
MASNAAKMVLTLRRTTLRSGKTAVGKGQHEGGTFREGKFDQRIRDLGAAATAKGGNK